MTPNDSSPLPPASAALPWGTNITSSLPVEPEGARAKLLAEAADALDAEAKVYDNAPLVVRVRGTILRSLAEELRAARLTSSGLPSEERTEGQIPSHAEWVASERKAGRIPRFPSSPLPSEDAAGKRMSLAEAWAKEEREGALARGSNIDNHEPGAYGSSPLPVEPEEARPGEPWTANDPHGANIEWRFVERWGVVWRGEWATGLVERYFTGDLGKWVATPERVALWARLTSTGLPAEDAPTTVVIPAAGLDADAEMLDGYAEHSRCGRCGRGFYSPTTGRHPAKCWSCGGRMALVEPNAAPEIKRRLEEAQRDESVLLSEEEFWARAAEPSGGLPAEEREPSDIRAALEHFATHTSARADWRDELRKLAARLTSSGLPVEEREPSDSERLDWLERDALREPLTLHDGTLPLRGRMQTRGLGFGPAVGRDLREAIDTCCAVRARQSSPPAAGPTTQENADA